MSKNSNYDQTWTLRSLFLSNAFSLRSFPISTKASSRDNSFLAGSVITKMSAAMPDILLTKFAKTQVIISKNVFLPCPFGKNTEAQHLISVECMRFALGRNGLKISSVYNSHASVCPKSWMWQQRARRNERRSCDFQQLSCSRNRGMRQTGLSKFSVCQWAVKMNCLNLRLMKLIISCKEARWLMRNERSLKMSKKMSWNLLEF